MFSKAGLLSRKRGASVQGDLYSANPRNLPEGFRYQAGIVPQKLQEVLLEAMAGLLFNAHSTFTPTGQAACGVVRDMAIMRQVELGIRVPGASVFIVDRSGNCDENAAPMKRAIKYPIQPPRFTPIR